MDFEFTEDQLSLRDAVARWVEKGFAFEQIDLADRAAIDPLVAQKAKEYADANQLAGFIGVFYAVVGIVWVLTNVFVIGTLFRRYGLRASLIVAPAALALSALAIVLALCGRSGGLDLVLAWCYVGVRVAHSLWQALSNVIKVRFALFLLSTLPLFGLVWRAARLLWG